MTELLRHQLLILSAVSQSRYSPPRGGRYLETVTADSMNVVLFVLALSHALLTWPLRATLVLFVGGITVAFVLEVIGIRMGLFRHRFQPQIASVPVTILLAWPAIIYLSHRISLLMMPAPLAAAALTAGIATAADALTEPLMIDKGAWEYPERPISHPRIRGVPWWNFVGWLGIVFVTALLPSFVMS